MIVPRGGICAAAIKRNYTIMAACAGAFLLLNIPSPAFAQKSVTSSKCPGEKGYYYTNKRNSRNPKIGGFVSDSANVGDDVFISRTAAVCGSASVLERARVYGHATINGEAEITGKARVYGNASVTGSALISGKAKISGHARVFGNTIVEGIAWMRGYYRAGKGHFTKGTHEAKKPAYVARREQGERNKKQREENKKLEASRIRQAKSELESIQRKLRQGWFGNDENKGVYRSFKFTKSDVKSPCGFYLRLSKEEKVLDSYCRKTKQVRRRRWIPGKGNFKTVKNCRTKYHNLGEKFFNFRLLRVGSHRDFSNKRDYLQLNNYYFYVGGNRRQVQEYGETLKRFARKYCAYKG